MALSGGTRLGPYEILAAIGAGGSASVRGILRIRELRRDLAEAKERTR